MGRKVNTQRLAEVLNSIKENDGKLRATDIAKQLGVHPQMITRLLPAFGSETEDLLVEDDRGFLGIFKR